MSIWFIDKLIPDQWVCYSEWMKYKVRICCRTSINHVCLNSTFQVWEYWEYDNPVFNQGVLIWETGGGEGRGR